MDITNEQADGVTTVALKGRLDAATARSVEEHLVGLIARGDRKLTIDLEKLAYISSAGLRVFIVAGKQMKASNGRIAICALSPDVAQIFTIAGFTTLFPLFRTRTEAISHLRDTIPQDQP